MTTITSSFDRLWQMYTLIPFLVGAFLLLTAALKAFYSKLFIIHVKRFRLIPEGPSALLSLMFIEIEAGLGIALMLEVYFQVLVPVVFCLIVFFSLLAWWGYRFRKLDECGCYGGLIRLSKIQSGIINLLLLFLLGFFYANASSPVQTRSQSLYIVVAVVLIFHFVSKHTVRKPLFDLLLLKVGKAWNSGLFKLELSDDDSQGTLIFILENHCSLCRNWIQKIPELATTEPQFQILILVASDDKKNNHKEDFPALNLPMHKISNWKGSLLRGRLPMAVKIENGVIYKIKSGTFPEDGFFL